MRKLQQVPKSAELATSSGLQGSYSAELAAPGSSLQLRGGTTKAATPRAAASIFPRSRPWSRPTGSRGAAFPRMPLRHPCSSCCTWQAAHGSQGRPSPVAAMQHALHCKPQLGPMSNDQLSRGHLLILIIGLCLPCWLRRLSLGGVPETSCRPLITAGLRA